MVEIGIASNRNGRVMMTLLDCVSKTAVRSQMLTDVSSNEIALII